jgi:hypothetical protein
VSGAVAFDARPVVARQSLAERWRRWWFEPEWPDNLGLCRLVFFGLLLAYYLPVSHVGWGSVPASFRNPIWLFERLHLPILPDHALAVLVVAWKVALAMACVGMLTRLSTALALLLGVYLIGLPYNFGKTDHMTAIVVWTMLVLALSRCGDAWSVDAWMRRRQAGDVPAQGRVRSGEYRWPVRAVWVVMATIFFTAGMAKVIQGGPGWVFSDNMAISLVQRYFDVSAPPTLDWGLRVAQHPWLAKSMAAGSLLLELSAPLALFSRRLRRVIPWMLLAMQIGIGVLMNVWFTRFFFAYVFWVPWGRIVPPARQED